MSRDNRVSFYVSDADKNRIEREANQASESVSTYLMGVLEQHWADADADEAADRMDAEEKIERVANKALEQIEDATHHTEQRVDDIADMVARSGSYSVANFELLKYQHGPPEGTKTDALRVGSRRLRAPLSDHPDLLNGDSTDDVDSLTVEDTENIDSESEDDDTDEPGILEGRGRSKEEAEKTRW